MPAGRPPKDVVAYDERITVRLHSAEKVTLEEDARVAGLSVGELVRRQYFNRPIVTDVDRTMIRELRRIGGLVKHIHNESAGAYSRQTANVLSDLQNFIRKLNPR